MLAASLAEAGFHVFTTEDAIGLRPRDVGPTTVIYLLTHHGLTERIPRVITAITSRKAVVPSSEGTHYLFEPPVGKFVASEEPMPQCLLCWIVGKCIRQVYRKLARDSVRSCLERGLKRVYELRAISARS